MTFLAAHLDLLLLGTACVLLMAGFPVAFTLGGVGLLFAFVGAFVGEAISFGAIPLRIFGIVTNEVLIAVPLFILMGFVLERSKVAEDLLVAMGWMARKLPGGMAISVTIVGALLAASTGIVGATVVTLGLMALPALLKSGYRASFACGTVAASGTLGQIIPPSIVLVFLADQLSTAYQTARRDLGDFSPDPFSVADLFAAALLPGLALVGLYIAYQLAVHWRRPPSDEQSLAAGEAPGARQLLLSILPPAILIVSVLGSILAGIATPTEAAALGAAGSVLIAVARVTGAPGMTLVVPGGCFLLLALLLTSGALAADGALQVAALLLAVAASAGLLGALCHGLYALNRARELGGILTKSVNMVAMVFAIVIGASVFSLVFRDLGGDETVTRLLSDLPGGTLGALIAVMAVMFVLGFFLDFLEIVFVAVPLVAPILLKMPMPDGTAMAPAWLGVMIAVNLQTSFLTPPFGFALFYLRGAIPASIPTGSLYRGVVPFVVLQLLLLVLLYLFPGLATWLPGRLYG